ncbi:glyoxalase superfamily protein [Kordiimonas sp. SCSIO 12610]|uniref:glyoxalase superfamily protein n=1 Tax=Kordiimonas sp. SCSIO 12610 TaxID=2829597 RepID=UPI00210D2EB9|nr:glyoxalase superfamily protein [Kordiimonas sp. SCSIO 12610]UTW56647.1 hypothetical protein KFF44_07080 [Kordiimonas sp. SCSIO 12610]
MNGSEISIPTIVGLKKRAKLKRKRMGLSGANITHSASLEATAFDYGFKDWNTLSGTVQKRLVGCPVAEGEAVSGTYKGQRFSGTVHRIAVKKFAFKDRYHLTINLDEAIDVVTFDSFSAFRKRLQCSVDETGVTAELLSSGEPLLRLDL